MIRSLDYAKRMKSFGVSQILFKVIFQIGSKKQNK